MSTVQEIMAAISKLPRDEQEQLRIWLEDYFEDQLELKEEVVTKLDHAREEIQRGQYWIRKTSLC